MPNPIPVAVLARLAVDQNWQDAESAAHYFVTLQSAWHTQPM